MQKLIVKLIAVEITVTCDGQPDETILLETFRCKFDTSNPEEIQTIIRDGIADGVREMCENPPDGYVQTKISDSAISRLCLADRVVKNYHFNARVVDEEVVRDPTEW